MSKLFSVSFFVQAPPNLLTACRLADSYKRFKGLVSSFNVHGKSTNILAVKESWLVFLNPFQAIFRFCKSSVVICSVSPVALHRCCAVCIGFSYHHPAFRCTDVSSPWVIFISCTSLDFWFCQCLPVFGFVLYVSAFSCSSAMCIYFNHIRRDSDECYLSLSSTGNN